MKETVEHQNPKKPKSPRKPLEERIAGVIKGLVPEMINVALKPVIDAQHETNSRLDRLEARMTKVEDRLEKLEHQVEYMNNVIEYNVQVGILKTPE